MNRENFINALIDFNGESEIYVETNNDNYKIYDLSLEDEDFKETTYMCSILGNWNYTSIEQLAVDLYDKIDEYHETIISVGNE